MTPRPVDDRADAARGALLGTAVGDCLGARFEGHPGLVDPEELATAERSSTPLRFTDDTAMTIALAESLLEVGGLDEDALAATFAEHWRREPHRGYGPGTAALLSEVAAGRAWRTVSDAQFGGSGSWGNGAAMRVAPVAVHAAGDVLVAVDLARRSAVVTHTHPLALDGAALQAAAVAVALGCPPDEQLDRAELLATVRHAVTEAETLARLDDVDRLVERGASAAEVASTLGTGVAAVEAVPTALCAFLLHPDSFRDAVLFAISLGGDTDTIAAMAAAVSGARLGSSSIPSAWLERAEGVDELRRLTDALAFRNSGGSRS